MKVNIKKLAVSAMLTAVAVSLSGFSIPIGASKCFPVQHLANVLAGVFLGPWYGVGMAFCTSFIRNLMGTGSLLAFPGSMVGAFLGGYLYQRFGRLTLAYVRHRHTGRNALLSGSHTGDGEGSSHFCLCNPISYEHHVRYGHCRVPDWRAV